MSSKLMTMKFKVKVNFDLEIRNISKVFVSFDVFHLFHLY